MMLGREKRTAWPNFTDHGTNLFKTKWGGLKGFQGKTHEMSDPRLTFTCVLCIGTKAFCPECSDQIGAWKAGLDEL